jgi:hypothetical protein
MVTEQIQEHVQSISNVGPLELFLAQIRLTGRTEAHADLVDQRPTIREQLGTKVGSVDVRIEFIDVETRPEVDLEARAQGDDAVAYLANLLLELETGERSDEHEPLVTDSLNAMRQTHSAGAYNILRRESDIDQPNQDDALEMVERQARVLLDTLLNQKEGKV